MRATAPFPELAMRRNILPVSEHSLYLRLYVSNAGGW